VEGTGILAFADHLHAHKPITHTKGKGNHKKQNISSLTDQRKGGRRHVMSLPAALISSCF